MFDRLTALLGSAGVDVSTDELLDVLWLAVARGASGPEDGPPPERSDGPRPAPGPLDETEDDLDLDVDHGRAGRLRENHSAEPPQGLYAQAGPADRGRPSRSVGVHGVRALRSPRALGRTMRPLHRTVDSRTEVVLDEHATVDRMAETGLPEPVLRPVPERWLSAALVIDDGPSMVLWRQMADEVKALLQAQGAFRDIRTHTMDSGGGTGPLVRSGGYAGARGAADGLRLDPARPTLVLVLSDMVGERWRTGAVHAALRTWAVRAPVAVLQPLPERMWPQSPAGPVERLLVSSPYPAAPGRMLTVSHPVFPDGLTSYNGTAIPVLEPNPGHLMPWVSLLTTRRSRAPLPVMLVPDEIPPPPPASSRPAPQLLSPQERFRRFREAASPESSLLAGALASVTPLTLPVMRLVHEAHRGDGARFHPAQLAEVFLGGLLRRCDSATAKSAENAEHEFYPGVADLLLDTVRTSVALDTAERVSDYLLRRGGAGTEFRARLDGGGTGTTPDLPEHAGPFAAASPQLLRRLGLPGGEQPPEPYPADLKPTGHFVYEPESPAEWFILEKVVPPLVAFADRILADPMLPDMVRKPAEHVVGLGHAWAAGFGWPGVHSLNLVGKALNDAHLNAYQNELAHLVQRSAEQLTEGTDLVTRNMRGRLAITLSALGMTESAVPHLRAVIALSSVEHGPLHQYTFNARVYLHEMFYDAGWLAEAEADGRTLLADFDRVAPEQYERALWVQCVQHQAFTLHGLGRWSEAEELLRTVLAAEEASDEDLLRADRLSVVVWLSIALSAQGRYAEAERELRAGLFAAESRPADEEAGGRHMALDALADLLHEIGRSEEAEPLRRAAIRASEEYYGADHARTMQARYDWLGHLQRLGRHTEALREIEELEPNAVSALGAQHEVTIRVRHLHGLLTADTQEYEQSLALQRRLLDEVTSLLGATHRTTMVLRHDYGAVLRDAGHHGQAEEWLAALLRDEDEHLEPDDSMVAATTISLAEVIASQGRADEALAICRDLLRTQLRDLPEGSLRTAAPRRQLVQLLAAAGAYGEAAEHAHALWTAYRGALGEEAPKTLTAAHQYGLQLHRAGLHRQAVEVLETLTEVRARVLGPTDRATLRSRMRFGDALAALAIAGAERRAHREWTAVREAAVREWGEKDELARMAAKALGSRTGEL
ncbi:tetratricopeptide repeat protein [Streptomyces sp. TRM75563]|uniref:tetratricopeptide repeat protein n=1 Tax=Streptomyces sp. TRM75563 TaxID=2817418 RepID=UPI001F60FB31|nr:tetratricopeptide repeat protein [Streptomyces sp. TRM75563]MCI4042485.1 tetratricopeptide repeat protein [Streptomyces sp. TRM75563]